MGYGTFAVGSCDVDGWVFILGVLEEVAEGDCVVEVFVVGSCSNALVHWELA